MGTQEVCPGRLTFAERERSQEVYTAGWQDITDTIVCGVHMERRLGDCANLGQSVRAGGVCDGCGRIQSKMERDSVGRDFECFQPRGEQFLDCEYPAASFWSGGVKLIHDQLHEHHPHKDFAKYDFFQILSIV